MSEPSEVVPEGSDVTVTGVPVPQKIEEALKDIPEGQRQRIRHILQETISLTAVQGALSPRIDPETAKIITESLDKDNEHKFQYLTQKQRDEAEASKREHDFAVLLHADRRKMLWPVLICVLFMVLGGISAGIYLTANGHEVLGGSLLTAILSGLFAYLAGLGTANFFKDKWGIRLRRDT